MGICDKRMPIFLGMHSIVVNLKIVFGFFEVVPIFREKIVFWWGEFVAESDFTGLEVKTSPNVAAVGKDGPVIDKGLKAERDYRSSLEEEAKDYYISLMGLNQSAVDEIYEQQVQHQIKLDELAQKGLLTPQLVANAEIEIKKIDFPA